MTGCARCGAELPPSRGSTPRKWCSDACRRLGATLPPAEDIADRDEVLRLLTARARAGAVTAMSALLRHYSTEAEQEPQEVDPFAELDAWSKQYGTDAP
jgi:hypothetical protein